MIARAVFDLRHPAHQEDAFLWLQGARAWLPFETCRGLLNLNSEMARRKILRWAAERRAACAASGGQRARRASGRDNVASSEFNRNGAL